MSGNLKGEIYRVYRHLPTNKKYASRRAIVNAGLEPPPQDAD